MGVIIKGTIVGAIIAYIWGMVSWMVIPWHSKTFETFKSEASVQTTILRNIESSGIYIMPSPKNYKHESEEVFDGRKSMPKSQIVMFAAINKDRAHAMTPMSFVYAFLTQMIIAFFLTWLTKATELRRYISRLFFIIGVTLTGGLMVYLPFWTWWQFPSLFVGVNLLDLLITWFLAGLAIAAFTKRHTQVVGL